MNATELVKELEESIMSDDIVMVRIVDPNSKLNGMMFQVKAVSGMFDHHEDGSTTAWIEVEEF